MKTTTNENGRALPSGWASVSLSEIADVRLGRQRSPKNHVGPNMRPYLRAANVDWNGLKLDDVKEMNFSASEVETYRLTPGDILLAEASGSASEVGKPAIWKGEIAECCFQNTLLRVRSHGPDPTFLLYLMKYEAVRGAFAQAARGVGIHHLGAAVMRGWPLRLPPFQEQSRIVAAIEEQFSRLDAAVGSLERARHNLERMRDSALRAAIQGRLGTQDVSDEPADVLLKRIIEMGNGKKQLRAENDPGSLESEPLPAGWARVRLRQVARTSSGGTPRRGRPEYFEGTIPWVKSGELGDGMVRETAEKITELGLASSSAKLIPRGTLMVALYGATVGKLGVLDLEKAATNQAVCAVSPVLPEMRDYLWLVLRARRRHLIASGKGGAQPNISQEIIRDLVFPLPPLDEQRRIVDNVARKMSLIDALAAAIDRSIKRADSLRRSVLRDAFNGRLVAQSASDEPASALLEGIAPGSSLGSTPRRK